MFRLFHNAVHDVCTRSLACFTFLHVPCTSSRRAHEQVLRRRRRQHFVTYPHQTGIGGTVSGKHLTGRSWTSTACDSSKTARSHTPRKRDGSACLPAPAEQHPYNLILLYYLYIRTYNTFAPVPKGGISKLHISQLSSHTGMLRKERATMSCVHEL